jgi:hypothetical protein
VGDQSPRRVSNGNLIGVQPIRCAVPERVESSLVGVVMRYGMTVYGIVLAKPVCSQTVVNPHDS